MLDINIIREKPDLVRKALSDRQMDPAPVESILKTRRKPACETDRSRGAQGRAECGLNVDQQDEGRQRNGKPDRGDAEGGG